MQTRNKLREAYDTEFAAVIERAEKQIILAKHGRRLLDLLDDSPVTPGDARRRYENGLAARQVLIDVEDDLKAWENNANAYDSILADDTYHESSHVAMDGSSALGGSGSRGGGVRGETPVMTDASHSYAPEGDENHRPAASTAPHVSPTPTLSDDERK